LNPHRLFAQQEKNPSLWGAEPRIELGPAFQQADALPTELHHQYELVKLYETHPTNSDKNYRTAIGTYCIRISTSLKTFTNDLCFFLKLLRLFANFQRETHFYHTDKKENLIFLIYKDIQNGAVAKSYMTNGLLIYGEIFAHLEALPHICMTLQRLHSEFPYR
jgi:hypothetical protein